MAELFDWSLPWEPRRVSCQGKREGNSSMKLTAVIKVIAPRIAMMASKLMFVLSRELTFILWQINLESFFISLAMRDLLRKGGLVGKEVPAG